MAGLFLTCGGIAVIDPEPSRPHDEASCDGYDECLDSLGDRLTKACGGLGPIKTLVEPDDPACMAPFEADVICSGHDAEAIVCEAGDSVILCGACSSERQALVAVCPDYSCG